MKDWKNYAARAKIAYFSMEIGLNAEIPNYSGGLGVLAGDTLKSAADLKLPMVGLTLVCRRGYFEQHLDAEGWQHESAQLWKPEETLQLLPAKTLVSICGRDVKVQAWMHVIRSPSGGEVPVLYLDTDIPGNMEEDRRITDTLYGGDQAYRLKQEMVLGIGGARLLDTLGFHVDKYHMNEGHASLLTVELLNQNRRPVEDTWDERASWDTYKITEKCVFTTHTPVAAGHDRFPYDLVQEVMGEPVPLSLLKEFAGEEDLNMTMLAMKLSGFVNGVAKKHGEVSKNMFPGFEIHAITNGIHPFTWTSPYFVSLFNRYIPSWAKEPELLVRVDNIPSEEVWDAHQGAKAYLFQYIEETTGIRLDPDKLTIGFARRAATYKRGDLILSDLERLLGIGRDKIQLVFGGKAHPKDEGGKKVIQQIYQKGAELGNDIPLVYLEDYNMEVASRLLPGVDIWLNNPIRPMEASGTSGMKAALNGVPNFSVLDGWWIEGHIEGGTGWSIGPPADEQGDQEANTAQDLEDLYRKLDEIIIPLYYNDHEGWVNVMKNSIGKIAYYFNTNVMMRRYVTEAYLA